MARKIDWDDDDDALRGLKKSEPKMPDDLLKFIISSFRAMEKLEPKHRRESYAKLELKVKEQQKHQRREMAAMIEKEKELVVQMKADKAAEAVEKAAQEMLAAPEVAPETIAEPANLIVTDLT